MFRRGPLWYRVHSLDFRYVQSPESHASDCTGNSGCACAPQRRSVVYLEHLSISLSRQSSRFPRRISAVTIAFAYLVYRSAHRPPFRELLKTIMLVAAFVFWAANQLWPDSPHAMLLNDIAIGLFVLDVFLVMIGWPATSPDESFAETSDETFHNR